MKIEYSLEVINKIFAALEEPFDPELLYWRAGPTNREKTKAVALVYADPRAYTDRLNEVLTPAGWSESYTHVVTPFRKKGYGDKPDIEGHKIITTCTVEIYGLGEHSSVGESETSDENVATVAEAQAFKRACTKFGLGRYFYDFPKNQWAPYDNSSKQITEPPVLPNWAMPKKKCDDCSKTITPETIKNVVYSAAAILRNSQKTFNRNLCAECQRKLTVAKAAPTDVKKDG